MAGEALRVVWSRRTGGAGCGVCVRTAFATFQWTLQRSL